MAVAVEPVGIYQEQRLYQQVYATRLLLVVVARGPLFIRQLAVVVTAAHSPV